MTSLRRLLAVAEKKPSGIFWGVKGSARLAELPRSSHLGARLSSLAGRSVVLAVRDQLVTALALIELDGVARRITLCPRDFDVSNLSSVFASAEAETIVSDQPRWTGFWDNWVRVSYCSNAIELTEDRWHENVETEWVLLTSGTTNVPKLVLHSLQSLTAALTIADSAEPMTWGTFYDINRYGGLQVLLRAVLGRTSFVLADADDSVAEYLSRLAEHSATHVLGTPTHWRRVIMSGSAQRISPQYVRLSGEVADQTVLNSLKELYPKASVAHAFASTEAGVGFAVNDGLEGFPANLLQSINQGVELKVHEGTLRIRSPGNARRYIRGGEIVKDEDRYVDTGDAVELRGDRYYFLGRMSGVINVGGIKVHPEEVEAVINTHSKIEISLVHAKKNPILGAIVVADIVLKELCGDNSSADEIAAIKAEVLQLCHGKLSKHKIPTSLNVVPRLAVGPTGKLLRQPQ